MIEKQTNVLGALLGDSEDILYSFDWKQRTIELNPTVAQFMKKNYDTLIRLINYSWALWLAEEDGDKPLSSLNILDGEMKRKGLDRYKTVLYDKFGETVCFYCNDPIKIKKEAHVDHFIPWIFIQDDSLWNLVICCRHCNVDLKKIGIPHESFISKLKERNRSITSNHAQYLQNDFSFYNDEYLDNVIDAAYNCGFETWNPQFLQ